MNTEDKFKIINETKDVKTSAMNIGRQGVLVQSLSKVTGNVTTTFIEYVETVEVKDENDAVIGYTLQRIEYDFPIPDLNVLEEERNELENEAVNTLQRIFNTIGLEENPLEFYRSLKEVILDSTSDAAKGMFDAIKKFANEQLSIKYNALKEFAKLPIEEMANHADAVCKENKDNQQFLFDAINSAYDAGDDKEGWNKTSMANLAFFITSLPEDKILERNTFQNVLNEYIEWLNTK